MDAVELRVIVHRPCLCKTGQMRSVCFCAPGSFVGREALVVNHHCLATNPSAALIQVRDLKLLAPASEAAEFRYLCQVVSGQRCTSVAGQCSPLSTLRNTQCHQLLSTNQVTLFLPEAPLSSVPPLIGYGVQN